MSYVFRRQYIICLHCRRELEPDHKRHVLKCPTCPHYALAVEFLWMMAQRYITNDKGVRLR